MAKSIWVDKRYNNFQSLFTFNEIIDTISMPHFRISIISRAPLITKVRSFDRENIFFEVMNFVQIWIVSNQNTNLPGKHFII